MYNHYFSSLMSLTNTRLWVNNPTETEIREALKNGAVSCTTNPAYCANLLKRERNYAINVINSFLKEYDNDETVADLVQQKVVARIAEAFMKVFDESGGKNGFVSIQGNPNMDDNAGHILDEAQRYRKLSPNIIAKIPATEAGFEAIEKLIQENVPIIVTEVFGLPQMIHACELYLRVARKSNVFPPYYVTHITGIMDEYLAGVVRREGIQIAPEVLEQAGLALARRQYRIFSSRNYPGIMLGGGARNTSHFTGLVGGNMHITINWSTAVQILDENPPIQDTLSLETENRVIEELLNKLPDFRCSWLEDGMDMTEFKDYGPVRFFRDMFLDGWNKLLDSISSQRREMK